MSQCFIGEVRLFAYTFAPRQWAFCNGATLPIAQNTALFSLLGTTYGGNGVTTFALPNTGSRVVVHPGQGPGLSSWTLGQQTGVATAQLLANQMPAHSHGIGASTGNATTASPAGAVPARGRAVVNGTTAALPMYQAPATQANMAATGTAGGNQPHPNDMPTLALPFCIALQGIFPSRN